MPEGWKVRRLGGWKAGKFEVISSKFEVKGQEPGSRFPLPWGRGTG